MTFLGTSIPFSVLCPESNRGCALCQSFCNEPAKMLNCVLAEEGVAFLYAPQFRSAYWPTSMIFDYPYYVTLHSYKCY